MTQAELKEKIQRILRKHQEHGVRYAVDEIMQLINDHVKDVIGEPNDIREALPADKYEEGFDYGYDTARRQIKERAGIE